jgi:hypothetical protein
VRRSFFLSLSLIAISFTVFAIPPQLGRRDSSENARRDATLAHMQKKNLENMNRERFLKVRQDSEKLLDLATELRSEIDDSDENILSVKAMRDAENIEKLAKGIREKMSEQLGPPVQ